MLGNLPNMSCSSVTESAFFTMLVCVCVWQRSNTCRNQVATSLSLAPVQDERWEGNLPPTHGRSALAAVWQARDSDAGKNLSNTYVTLAVRSWKLETNLHSTRCTRWQLSCRWQKAMWTPLRLCSNCFFLFLYYVTFLLFMVMMMTQWW